MPDAQDIPQSVVEAARSAFQHERGVGGSIRRIDKPLAAALAAALAEYERLGWCLVRVDEATVERMAKALYEGPDEFGRARPEGVTWESMLSYGGLEPGNRDQPIADEYRRMARAALTAAPGGDKEAVSGALGVRVYSAPPAAQGGDDPDDGPHRDHGLTDEDYRGQMW